MRLLLTRPRLESEALGRVLVQRGHRVVVEPVLEIAPVGGPLDLAGVQALVATSANGIRAAAARIERRDLPIFAVGAATAEAARAAGFARVESADGDAEALGRVLARRVDLARGALLHVAGRDVARDLVAPGIEIRRAVVYEARPVARLGAGFVASQEPLDGALFFSPRSAAAFVTLMRQAGIAERAGRMIAFCLSPAVAEAAAALTWNRIAVAARPERRALLDLIPAP